jgi:predicted transcriptional regulator
VIELQGGVIMPSDLPKITTRTDDIQLKLKLQKLARKNGRTLSREVEQILKRYIAQYENNYGEIKVDK